MTKRIEINLADQTLTAFDGTSQVYSFDCISGDDDHPTDPGTFHIFLKDATHFSHTYHVKMYYALFFTRDGKAIHQYHGPGFWLIRNLKVHVSDWFGSHGCCRLQEDDARTLFNWAPLHTTVHIV